MLPKSHCLFYSVQSNSASIPVTQSQQQQKQSKLEVPTKDESCSPATLAVNKLSLFLRLNSEKSPQQVDRSECSTVDDLRRLTDSLYHLTLSGFYYGSISWKESVEILRKCQVPATIPQFCPFIKQIVVDQKYKKTGGHVPGAGFGRSSLPIRLEHPNGSRSDKCPDPLQQRMLPVRC